MNNGFCVELGAEFLADIEECRSDLAGFVDGTGTYSYDANGNMVIDPDKGINISFNHLNLPYLVTFTDGRWIRWTYDAAGTKLRKTTSMGLVQDYVNGLEYRNSVLEAIYHEEGRAVFKDNTFEYQYCLKDHLGNTRVMFRDGGSGVAELLQENHYYAYGGEMRGTWSQPNVSDYTYNGKELNEDFGLGWLDYGARWRDPFGVVWGQVDPLAEKYYAWSPYNIVVGNPIRFIDPDGKAVEDCCGGIVAGVVFQAVTGLKFDLSFKVDIGLQVGAKVNVGIFKVDAKVDAGSVELVSGSTLKQELYNFWDDENSTQKTERGAGVSFSIIDEDVAGIGVEFERNIEHEGKELVGDQSKAKAFVSVGQSDIKFDINTDTKTQQHEETRFGVDVEVNAVIGIQLKAEFVKEHNNNN